MASSLGDRIRRARENLDLTQRELSELVGVSRETVGNWETGTSTPRGKISRLEQALAIQLVKPADEPWATPTSPATILTLPEQVVDGLAIPELEELRADLVARSYTKSAEIRSRPGRRSGYDLAAHQGSMGIAKPQDSDHTDEDYQGEPGDGA